MARRNSPLRNRVIFLVGARRSGTNWLQRALAGHPGIVYLPSETYLFSHGIAPLTEVFQHANPGSPMMARTYIRRDSFLDAVRDLVDAAFVETLEHLPTARYYIERTPWHVLHLDLIHDVFPDARVIHIIRDGRAVARSLLSMDWGPKTMDEAAREWRDAIRAGRRGASIFEDRYLEVFYERLLADPRDELERLISWLELQTPEKTWTEILLEALSEFNVDPRSPGVREDKWRQELSQREIREFERVAGAELEALGYERMAGAAERKTVSDTLGRLTDGVRRGSRLVTSARRPRVVARTAAVKAFDRQSRRSLHKKHEIVERFERTLAHGSLELARSMLAPGARVQMHDGSHSFRGRGEDAVSRLLTAIEEHRGSGFQIVTGELYGSPGTFTSVLTYELEDGSMWTRTLVFYVTYPKIAEIIMYRFRVATDYPAVAATVAARSLGPAG